MEFNTVNERDLLIRIFCNYGRLEKDFKKGKFIIKRTFIKTGSGRFTRNSQRGYFSIEKITKITEKTVNGYLKSNCFCITELTKNKIENKQDIINNLFN